MNPTLDAFVRSWPSDPLLAGVLLVSTAIYVRGWRLLHRRDASRWHAGRLAAFLGGLSAIYLALASPIEPFASLLLEVHMLQHLLLMMVAPPLVWIAWPLFPLLRGLPQPVRAYWVAPLLRSKWLRHVFSLLTHPLVAGPVYVGVTWLWHSPRAYQLALASSTWHVVEHACFVAAALLFWYPVVRPCPSRPKWSEWLLFPYLILADVQNTLLAAWLTFSPSVIYTHYERVPRLGGITALDDQAAAGVLMWVPGSIAFLVPLFWIGIGLLFGKPQRRPALLPVARREKSLALASSQLAVIEPMRARPARSNPVLSRFDLLRLPIIGTFLSWRHSRRAMQSVLLLLAVVVVFDGLTGPQVGAMNLAGVLPWIHWRGVLILGLLVAGNVFCMACPFTLPRSLARRWLPQGRPWPRWLRSKWLAIGLLVLFLWSYEAFALWDSPWLTAVITLAYFAAAFAVDGVFKNAAFCKYVCPIGQFNFVQSLVSPFEVKVREPATCASCRTHECILGTQSIAGTVAIGGCQLHLFQPHKVGNLDCTFCLDCVHACPHENVGVLPVVPAATLWSNPLRSGIGRLSRRPDVAALVVVLVFGSLANAAGMVGPVLDFEDLLRAWLGNPPVLIVTTIFYACAVVVLPALLVAAAAVLGSAKGSRPRTWLAVATRYSLGLVPIGFGMWLAHYSFHLLTSYETVVPTTQRFAARLSWSGLGEPLWQCACCRPAGEWVLHSELLMLDFAMLLSLYTAWRIAENDDSRGVSLTRRFGPWAALIVLLFSAGVWIVFQPMQMRGTLPAVL